MARRTEGLKSTRRKPPRGPDPWAAAVDHLRAADARWGPLIDRAGPCALRPHPDRFGTLVRSILAQQISTKAARSIHQRLLDLQDARRHDPRSLRQLGEARLRSAGLSRSKARYVLHLAEAVEAGALPLSQIGRLSDQTIIKRLTRLPGIGVWTAEMFLVFALNRPDVFSAGDLGIRAALAAFLELPAPPPPRDCVELAEPWRPYRTIAMWYLWRSKDDPPASEA